MSCENELKAVHQRMVSPIEALKRFLTVLTPGGRSSRSDVWWVVLFVNMPIYVVQRLYSAEMCVFWLVLSLLLIWPTFCLFSRRLHDLDRHMGWAIAWLLFCVIGCATTLLMVGGGQPPTFLLMLYQVGSCVTGCVLLVVSCVKSKGSSNKYGGVPNLMDARDDVK